MKDIHKTKAKLIEELEVLRAQARAKEEAAENQRRLQESKCGLEKRVQHQIAELKHSDEALEQEISERVETESRLQESNQLLESVFSSIHMMIAYLDTDFNFIRVNAAYARAAGQPAAYFPGKNHFALYPHEENERIFRSVVSSGKSYTVHEKPFVYPEHPGRVTYWDWTIQPVKTERGSVSGLILSLIDVTSQIENRKKIEVYAKELEIQNKTLSDFAFFASHDLREPLRKILTFGSLLKSSLAGTLKPNDRNYIERMQDAARRMQTMLDGLLKYARISAKTPPYSTTNLTQAANEAVSNLQVRIEEIGATVAIEPLPVLHADYTQMLQLFQNLIGNALNFHRKGVSTHVKVSGKIVARKNSPDTNGKHYELRVEDNGIGFDPKYRDRIFLPFTRLQGRQGPEGAGMGLAICRKIVEHNGGTIRAKSEAGKGSVFIVTLPVNLLKQGKIG
jgi:PAS domain S-box-containing protein